MADERAPGLWVPFAVLGLLIPVIGFVLAFVGSIRVLERNLTEDDTRLDRLEQREDAATNDRRDLAVRLGRLEDGRNRP